MILDGASKKFSNMKVNKILVGAILATALGSFYGQAHANDVNHFPINFDNTSNQYVSSTNVSSDIDQTELLTDRKTSITINGLKDKNNDFINQVDFDINYKFNLTGEDAVKFLNNPSNAEVGIVVNENCHVGGWDELKSNECLDAEKINKKAISYISETPIKLIATDVMSKMMDKKSFNDVDAEFMTKFKTELQSSLNDKYGKDTFVVNNVGTDLVKTMEDANYGQLVIKDNIKSMRAKFQNVATNDNKPKGP